MEITAYVVDEGRISPLRVTAQREIPARAIWVDVSGATREETISLAEQLGLQLELDAADLGFDVYGHVEVEGDQLTIVMQVDRAEAMDSLSDSQGVTLVSTNKLVTFRSGSIPAIEALLAHRAQAESPMG